MKHVIYGQEDNSDVIEWRLKLCLDEPVLEARKGGGRWMYVAMVTDKSFDVYLETLNALGLTLTK